MTFFSVRIKCILKSQEPAIDKDNLIAIYAYRHSLSNRTCRILKSDVLGTKSIPKNIKGGRACRSGFFAETVFFRGKIIVGQHRVFAIFPNEDNIGFTAGKHQLFLVYSPFDEDAGFILPEIGHGIDSLLNSPKIACTISCHYKMEVAGNRREGRKDKPGKTGQHI